MGGLVGSFQNDGSKDGAVVRYRGLADGAKFWDVGQLGNNSFSINGRNNATLYILENGNVGIGTDSPDEKLVVTGSIKMVDGNQSVGFIPISDANGKMTWTDPSSIISPDTNWVAKLDTLYTKSAKFVGLGTAAPKAQLDVASDILVNGLRVGRGASDNDASVALGYLALDSSSGASNTAIGGYSMINNTSGYNNVAVGTEAMRENESGVYNAALGWRALGNNIDGTRNTALGATSLQYNVFGSYNTAIGGSALAEVDSSNNNTAVGYRSGYRNRKGNSNTLIGNLAMYESITGNKNTAIGDSTMITNLSGSYNTVIGANSDVGDDSLTNATAIGANAKVSISNALILGNNVNVGIGTDIPAAKLHVTDTSNAGGNVLFTGLFKSVNPGAPPDSGAGTRMMWYPDKGTFRAGAVSGTQWDKDNIGSFSVAMGVNNIASGYNSLAFGQSTTASDTLTTAIGFLTNASKDFATAIGYGTTASGTASLSAGILSTASGEYAIAMGYNSNASGIVSVALGNETVASNTYSTALGYFTIASGYNSTSLGSNTEAKSGFETVIGKWNTDYTPIETSGWNNSDRLFVVGNGTASDSRSDAVTVLKNGNVGIGSSTPSTKLEIVGKVKSNDIQIVNGAGAGKVLISDSDGNGTWQKNTYSIGDFAHGGVVFWVDETGKHGLVCAIEDQSTGVKWRGGSTSYHTMARGNGIYAGKMNTSIIISVHSAKNDYDNHAALVCANYGGGGYGDWYLPSLREFEEIVDNKTVINSTAIANNGSAFATAYYWTSTETSSHVFTAWIWNFNSNWEQGYSKDYSGYVRAIRAF